MRMRKLREGLKPPQDTQPGSGGARVRAQAVWLRRELPFSLRTLGKGARAHTRGSSLYISSSKKGKNPLFLHLLPTHSTPPPTLWPARATCLLYPPPPDAYLEISSMLGAQLGKELRGVWDVTLQNLLQPGQGRGREGRRVRREGDRSVLPSAPQL